METNNIDKMIRLQLLCNPELNLSYCEKTIKKLHGMCYEGKQELLQKLKPGSSLFRQKVTNNSDPNIKESLREKVESRINEWGNSIDRLSLNDLNKIQLATGLSLGNLLETYVTPENLFLAGQEYVKGQDEMLKSIALHVYTHKLRIDHPDMKLPKTNMLIYGQSGVGKTYAVQVMTRILDIPVGRLNCAILTQEGIVGYNFNDVFTDLYIENDNDLNKVANAIIIADEADKLFDTGYYNQRIRNEILPALDDDSNLFFNKTKGNISNYVNVSTANMSFILSGVFKEVVEKAMKRKNTRKLGFCMHKSNEESGMATETISVEDFRSHFDSPELSGRIGSYVAANELKSEDLANILLYAESSPLESYTNFFRIHGRNLEMTEDAASAIANHVMKTGLGVRAMKSLLSSIMKDEMSMVGSKDASKTNLVISKEFVESKIK